MLRSSTTSSSEHVMSDARDDDLDPEVERASEIDDLTGEIPVVFESESNAGAGDTGFGDGDLGTDDERDDLDDVDLSELEAQFEHDVDAVLAERDQFKDLAMRLQADFDNYRKRMLAQSADEVDRATGRLAEAFLPVLDAAEAAFVRHPDEVGPLLNVMLTELKRHGLESLDLDGQPFDPEVAEAVAHEPGDGGEVVVAEVLRSGYRWRGRTLRAAMVRTRD
jgi:molecular chaperone GrpE